MSHCSLLRAAALLVLASSDRGVAPDASKVIDPPLGRVCGNWERCIDWIDERPELDPANAVTYRHLAELQRAQYQLRRIGIRMAAKRILFDIPTEHGSARPDFLVALLDEQTGQELKFALQVLQSRDDGYLELRAIERDRLSEIGPVVALDLDDIAADEITERARMLLG